MKPIRQTIALAAILASAATAQEFEVASVKPNPGGQGMNTRMNGNADGIRYIAVPLKWIVAEAYNVPHTQVFGPDWIGVEAYDIVARVPPGTTAAQRRTMLQSLLAQRFHMKAHRETRDVQSLVLTVAKQGPKMQTTTEPASGYRISQDGSIRHMKVNASPKAFAAMLGGLVQEPVVDQTGLTGVYQIAVDWDVSVPSESADNLLRAVQGQLGLKIERKKVPLEVAVVEQADKVPTEN